MVPVKTYKSSSHHFQCRLAKGRRRSIKSVDLYEHRRIHRFVKVLGNGDEKLYVVPAFRNVDADPLLHRDCGCGVVENDHQYFVWLKISIELEKQKKEDTNKNVSHSKNVFKMNASTR